MSVSKSQEDTARTRARQLQRFSDEHKNSGPIKNGDLITDDDLEYANTLEPLWTLSEGSDEAKYQDSWKTNPTALKTTLNAFRRNAPMIIAREQRSKSEGAAEELAVVQNEPGIPSDDDELGYSTEVEHPEGRRYSEGEVDRIQHNAEPVFDNEKRNLIQFDEVSPLPFVFEPKSQYKVTESELMDQ